MPKDPLFIFFNESTEGYLLPNRLSFLSDGKPHGLCVLASEQLQQYLHRQTEWSHNFGLSEKEGVVIGKMFGVLVVKNEADEIGYLAAFSGKLAGKNHHSYFVPPVFDTLSNDCFLNEGMAVLTSINEKIETLELLKPEGYKVQILHLKDTRKKNSIALQKKLFDQYHFLNQAGKEKSLRELFLLASCKNPPSGAGECAAPKLFQYAFQHRLKPIAMAEFWWGASPKSTFCKHGHFYPCCKEKCEPILAHMLSGIDYD